MKRDESINHTADLCVVGGGMAGICSAVSAARQGLKVVLMHDRPVLGGNASSECRVHICGADRHNKIKNMRETGILEELRMLNLSANPQKSFSVWDTILYGIVKEEPNITLLLNCSCLEARMEGHKIVLVKGWQLTTQRYHNVESIFYADCSGDSVLGPLTGAAYRSGRESEKEYGEPIAPAEADDLTMGMTCLFLSAEHKAPQPFKPPKWAYTFKSCEEMPYGEQGHQWLKMGYWWIELGGENHSIYDTELLRDELLKTVYGVWDHIKNYCPNKKQAENMALEWVQFLPAKRESRRYKGLYVMSQNDIESGGNFYDTVAYGGWTMDIHHPAGFKTARLNLPATIFHDAPSPYGIPLRSLISANIDNLLFAGRNASFTHVAMSSSRVMGTACSMGQAIGVAASEALKRKLPIKNLESCVKEIQQTLLYQDAYIPNIKQQFNQLTMQSRLLCGGGDAEPVRDGINRPVGKDSHSYLCRRGSYIEYSFDRPVDLDAVSLILDSGLDKNVAMSYHQNDDQLNTLPDCMPKNFRIEVLTPGGRTDVFRVKDNRRRLVRIAIKRKAEGVRYVLEDTYGCHESRVYGFYLG